MKAECGMSALCVLEPAEIRKLLLIEYKLVFNKILFQEVCDYLSIDWPIVSVHFKAGNGVHFFRISEERTVLFMSKLYYSFSSVNTVGKSLEDCKSALLDLLKQKTVSFLLTLICVFLIFSD